MPSPSLRRPDTAPGVSIVRNITGHDELTYRKRPGPATRLISLTAALWGEEESAIRSLTLSSWEERLLTLRSDVFGPRIEAELMCPDCGTGALLVFDTEDLPVAATPVQVPETGMDLSALTTGDIADLEEAGLKGEEALAFLLSRAGELDSTSAADTLQGPRREELIAALEILVAGLALELGTTCVDCGSPITAPFDVSAFVDAEIETRAARLLDEVHVIAMAYHWGHSEILDLPFFLRQAYISRILGDQALTGRTATVV